MSGDPLVSIRCLVYNHEPYLRQCLDGFVMQQTDFPFEAIVHDDASTDGSAAIIREYAEKYPHIIKPVYETENQYSKHDGSLARVMDAAMHPNSKYVALCEGDDYWTDPHKLQMQVDIMEGDSEVGLVHTLAKVFDQQAQRFLPEMWGQPIESFEDELFANKPVTLTVCFRKDLFIRYNEFRKVLPKNWRMGDYPLFLFLSYHSKTIFINRPTGVYRLLKYSACHHPDIQKNADFEVSAFNIQTFFSKHFHHEHLLKSLATNLVTRLQKMSVRNNKSLSYDFWGIYSEFGLTNSLKLVLRHYVLKNRFSRTGYIFCNKALNKIFSTVSI